MPIGFQSKLKNRSANSVDPDETARYELSHLDLHCLHRYLFWSAMLKGLMEPLLSIYMIAGYCRLYQWRANILIRLCRCVQSTESMHFMDTFSIDAAQIMHGLKPIQYIALILGPHLP